MFPRNVEISAIRSRKISSDGKLKLFMTLLRVRKLTPPVDTGTHPVATISLVVPIAFTNGTWQSNEGLTFTGTSGGATPSLGATLVVTLCGASGGNSLRSQWWW